LLTAYPYQQYSFTKGHHIHYLQSYEKQKSWLLDRELLRRDEVWFTEKDKNGGSHLYSLVEFKVRKDLKLDKGYHRQFKQSTKATLSVTLQQYFI